MTNSKIVYLWLLILLLANGWRCCYCCWNEERTALLQLKANINYSTSGDDYLSSWGANETSDCCRWEGIVCSNTTRRVVELSIIAKEEKLSNGTYTDDILGNWLFNASLFVPFKNLKALLLPGHYLAGWVKNEGSFRKLRRLRNLEVLDLSGNRFNHSIFEPISQLSSLKSLNLSRKDMRSGSGIWFTHNKTGSGLDKLEILDLSVNSLDLENVFSTLQLGALRNIEYLLLERNILDENFLRSGGVMSSLKVLSVAQCDLNGTLPLQGLCDLKYLEELCLNGNRFSGKLPPCLGNLTFLRVIDLTDNQFTGNIASSPLSSLLSLEYLLIANNNFEIPISFESFANHSKLKFVSASENSVIVQTTSKSWIPKFQLEALTLSNCSQIPSFLHYQHHFETSWSIEMQHWVSFADMKNLEALDLSYNKLKGELPIGLARKGSKLYFLRLSNNLLDGEIFPALADINNLEYLYLDGNNFSGPIPQKLVTAPFLSILDLSDNNLSGNIPAWLGNISSLKYLGLSRNHLKGHIPPDYCRLEGPEVLDLSENNLVVMIPSCFSAFRDLKHVHLSKNKLQGEFNMFSNSSYLQLLDLRDNNFSGSIPKWLGSTSDITILLLKGNRLQGTIPPLLCHASYLRILDLSHNDLSGPIPHCLGNIMQQASITVGLPYHIFGYGGFEKFGGDALINMEYSMISFNRQLVFQDIYAWVRAEFTTKYNVGKESNLTKQALNQFSTYNTYSYEGDIISYMSGVDLSCNQLSGEIPKELSNLTEIHALNLSHNHFTGVIPSEFSNLQNIESLDLSYNNLTGSIPTQLLKLTTLDVFTVAHTILTEGAYLAIVKFQYHSAMVAHRSEVPGPNQWDNAMAPRRGDLKNLIRQFPMSHRDCGTEAQSRGPDPQLVRLLCFGRPSHLVIYFSMAFGLMGSLSQLFRQRAFWAFGFGNAHHVQGPGSGRDKLDIRNTVMPPRRIIDQNAQADEVHPSHRMRTRNRAHTPEPVPNLGVLPVPTSPPRAPRTNVNRPPTAQGDISNAEFRCSVHILTQLVAN
ncbi:putative rhamnogalacturonate lyase-like [Capsicum annuum]|nr:putative rhamnogalacturonate lyase-like [Capsicum annuum]